MDDQTFWDVAFSQLVAFQYHPANPPEKRVPLDRLAEVVEQMMSIRRSWMSSRSVYRVVVAPSLTPESYNKPLNNGENEEVVAPSLTPESYNLTPMEQEFLDQN